MTVWSDENEVDAAEPGENVKLKLKNVEEDVSHMSRVGSHALVRFFIFSNLH